MPPGSTRCSANPSCPTSPRSRPRSRRASRSSRVAEFVTDPRSTFPSFDTTVATDANGFFVLDFILFLEYIESTFYAVNVPRFT